MLSARNSKDILKEPKCCVSERKNVAIVKVDSFRQTALEAQKTASGVKRSLCGKTPNRPFDSIAESQS